MRIACCGKTKRGRACEPSSLIWAGQEVRIMDSELYLGRMHTNTIIFSSRSPLFSPAVAKLGWKTKKGMKNNSEMRQHGAASKRNLTFNLLDPDQIRLTLCYTDYFALHFLFLGRIFTFFIHFQPYFSLFMHFSTFGILILGPPIKLIVKS